MKNLNLSSVTDTSGLPAGGYILKIKSVEDVESKEYLKVQLDIAEGPYADYYANLDDRYGFWGLIWYMSYKSKALGLFKSGIKAIKASNASFVWDDDAANDEQQMVGCLIGGLLREECSANPYKGHQCDHDSCLFHNSPILSTWFFDFNFSISVSSIRITLPMRYAVTSPRSTIL